MSGDYSRDTFRRDQHFTGVRLQQGRVRLDADFNEQVDIANDALWSTVADVLGSSGAPEQGGGFEIQVRNLLRFDGVDDYADTEPAADFSFHGHQPFTLEAWSRLRPGEVDGTLFAGHDRLGRTWFRLAIDPAGRLRGRRGAEGAELATEPLDWSEARRLALVFDGAWLRLYVDGECVAEAEDGSALDNHQVELRRVTPARVPVVEGEEPQPVEEHTEKEVTILPCALRVGASVLPDGRPSEHLAGELHALRVWRCARDPQQLAVEVPIHLDPARADLAADWRLGEGQGRGAVDETRSNHTLTLGPGGPDTAPAWELRDVRLSAGRFYVDGRACELDRPVELGAQPMLPDTPLPERDGVYLAWLDAWERTVTARHDPMLGEAALGGLDTAVRRQLVAQVRLLLLADDPEAEVSVPASGLDHPRWEALVSRLQDRGTLTARRRSKVLGEPLDTRLYRVEVVRAGIRVGAGPSTGQPSIDATVGEAGELELPLEPGQWVLLEHEQDEHLACVVPGRTGARLRPSPPPALTGEVTLTPVASFVWSRNNGADQLEVLAARADEVALRQSLRDADVVVRPGDVVQLTDRRRDLQRTPPVLRRVTGVSADGLRLSLDRPLADDEVPEAPALVQVWAPGSAKHGPSIPIRSGWMELERGIEVSFDGPAGHALGDAWTIPARAQTRTVQWPHDEAGPLACPPSEGARHLARLAVLRFRDGGVSAQDLRRVFPALGQGGFGDEDTDSHTLTVPERLHVTGDAALDGTVTVGLLKGSLAPGMVDTPQLRDRSVGGDKLASESVGRRQLSPEVGLVPPGYSILGESPAPPPGFVHTRQQVALVNRHPRWRSDQALAGVDLGRAVLATVGEDVFALLDNGEIWVRGPTTDGWQLDAEMRPVRRDFGVGEVDGCLHILGGEVDGQPIADHDIYDTSSRTWTKGPAMLQPRAGLAVAVVERVVFVIGGRQNPLLSTRWRDLLRHIPLTAWIWRITHTVARVDAYEVDTRRWVTSWPMPTARCNAGVAEQSGRIHVLGGRTRRLLDVDRPTDAHEAFLPAVRRGLVPWPWRAAPRERRAPLRTPCSELAAVAHQGSLYALGGLGWDGITDEVRRYEPQSDTWHDAPPLPSARRDLGATCLYGDIFVLGGVDPSGPTSSAASCSVATMLFVHRKGTREETPTSEGGSTSLAAAAAAEAAATAASVIAAGGGPTTTRRGPPVVASSRAPHVPEAPRRPGSLLRTVFNGVLALLVVAALLYGGVRLVRWVFGGGGGATGAPDLSQCHNLPGSKPSVNTGPTDARLALGIDASHNNGPMPWSTIQAQGTSFVYVKATEGAREVDPMFQDNFDMLGKCAIRRGAYHFYRPEIDPKVQAAHFLDTVGDDQGELPLVVDVETPFKAAPKRNCQTLLPDVLTFIETVEADSALPVMVYTGHGFWKAHFTCAHHPGAKAVVDKLGTRPLWVAEWSGRDAPRMFGSWTTYAFWQYTEHGKVNGHLLDLDRFNGDEQDLDRWLEGLRKEPTTTPSPSVVVGALPFHPPKGAPHGPGVPTPTPAPEGTPEPAVEAPAAAGEAEQLLEEAAKASKGGKHHKGKGLPKLPLKLPESVPTATPAPEGG